MVGALLKPLSALSVASATSNLPPVRPVPDRACRRATNFAKFVHSSKRRARGRVLTPHPPPSGRESQDVLDWLRRLTLFGIGFKLVRTPTSLPARADAGRPATGGTSGAQSANFRMALGAGVLEPRPTATAHPKLTN